jgi:hypothetical protein
MAASNRATLLTKTHRVLKKHYKPVAPAQDRTLFEHMLFACLLEDAPYDKAETCYAHVTEQFFDLNEVRVSSVRELSESFKELSDPVAAATRLKRVLQHVFESSYSFDVEALKKQNIGVALKRLHKMDGTTEFVVRYANQVALGGHAIPIDRGALMVLVILGVIDQAEADKQTVPGMERAIPKIKGIEFGSLLHQLGTDLLANPLSPDLRKILLEANPDCQDRLPKRKSKKKVVAPTEKEAPVKPAKKTKAEAKAKPAKKSAATKKAAKPAAAKKKSATKKTATKKSPAKKPAKKAPAKKPAKKTPAKKPAKKTPAKKAPAKKKPAKKKTATSKKSTTKSLARKKPR